MHKYGHHTFNPGLRQRAAAAITHSATLISSLMGMLRLSWHPTSTPPYPCLQDSGCGGAGLQRPEQQPGQWRQQWRHGEVRAWGRPPCRLAPRAVHPPPQRTHQPLLMVSLRGGAPAPQQFSVQCCVAFCRQVLKSAHQPFVVSIAMLCIVSCAWLAAWRCMPG